MQNKTRKVILAVSFAIMALVASALPVAAQNSYYNLGMNNNTGFDIYKLYFSSVNSNNWGYDLLGTRIFYDGNRFTLTQISPGHYDVKFVDEDEDVCVMRDVPVYRDLNWDLSQR